MKQMVFTIMSLLILIVSVRAKDYNIVDFGAVSDGFTVNTKSIQSAIDKAHEAGGGRVVFPSGKFISGSIHIKSDVELHLTRNAVLLGSLNFLDYDVRNWTGFIMSYNSENVSITGKGLIDGQGGTLGCIIDSLFYAGELDSSKYNFVDKRPKAKYRPMLILLTKCNNVLVRDVTLLNGSSWVQNYVLCNGLVIDNVTVDSDSYWNNDGMDISDCTNVRITNCTINSSDDGICLKSFRYGTEYFFCDSVYVGNCSIRSSANAIKLGTSSKGGFKNIVIEKIKIYDTYRSAIALESYQNAVLENVLIQDITAKNTGNAIFIRLGDRHPTDTSMPFKATVRNIVIKNLKVSVPFKRPDYKYELRGPALAYFHNIMPSSITGIPGYPVENVTLENIQITYPGRGNKAYANMPVSRLEMVPEKISEYPEFSMFGELPAWGLYFRHVDGITLKNVTIKIKDSDYRPAIVCDDVKNMRIEALKVRGDKKTQYLIQKDSDNISIID
jgi:parallel beta-helix repeat protein